MMEDAIKSAIDKAGGPAKLARAIGIKSQAVSQWEICPINRVVAVEQATGVSRYELRPDIFGESPAQAMAS